MATATLVNASCLHDKKKTNKYVVIYETNDKKLTTKNVIVKIVHEKGFVIRMDASSKENSYYHESALLPAAVTVDKIELDSGHVKATITASSLDLCTYI